MKIQIETPDIPNVFREYLKYLDDNSNAIKVCKEATKKLESIPCPKGDDTRSLFITIVCNIKGDNHVGIRENLCCKEYAADLDKVYDIKEHLGMKKP